MHSTYSTNLRSSFERLIPRHSFALLLSAAGIIMPEVRSSQGVWCTKWLGSQLDRNNLECMLGIEGLGDNSKISKIERTEKN